MSRSGEPRRDAEPPGSGPPLVEIARQIRAGIDSAWRDFHDRLATWVSWHVRRRFSRKLRLRFEPTDLIQATWLRIVQHLPRLELRDDPSLLAWIVQVVENGATDLERHSSQQRRDIAREVELAPFLDDGRPRSSAERRAALPAALCSATADHVDRFWLDEELAELEDALEQLPHELRATFLAIAYDGLSGAAAGRRFGTSESTALRQFRRARAALAARLGAAAPRRAPRSAPRSARAPSSGNDGEQTIG
ncbi:MAG: sigma-70 family RNA polymerase sigma factor [Planctomycetes bacterium]|nr:sigma-70 family RNA polymerase sigma factor [Planctomycetota bacterium]